MNLLSCLPPSIFMSCSDRGSETARLHEKGVHVSPWMIFAFRDRKIARSRLCNSNTIPTNERPANMCFVFLPKRYQMLAQKAIKAQYPSSVKKSHNIQQRRSVPSPYNVAGQTTTNKKTWYIKPSKEPILKPPSSSFTPHALPIPYPKFQRSTSYPLTNPKFPSTLN